MWGRKGQYNRRGLRKKSRLVDPRDFLMLRTKRAVQPPPPNRTAGEEGEEGGGGAGKNKFFACYLLTSINPRFKARTYIGFTVNPKRRIRQHNGEISSGANKTKSGRPWEMVMCIYGFPSNVAALKFEWAWQNPTESVNVREAVTTFKSLNGLGNKIKLALTMLTLPNWHRLDLTVNYFSTKYAKYAARSPTLPRHIRVQIGSMDDLPCYTGGSIYVEDDELLSSDEGCDKSDESPESAENESGEGHEVINDEVPVVQDVVKLRGVRERPIWDMTDEGCDQSNESPESAENESAEGHKVINDEVPVVQDVVKLRGGRVERPIWDMTEISQSSEEFHQEILFTNCDKSSTHAEDREIFRSSDELQSKNLRFGEPDVPSQSLRWSEEFSNGSIQHDPNSYEDLPHSFTDCDELSTNAKGIFRLSDEFQSKNLRFGEQEVHRQSLKLREEFRKSSIQHDPYSFTDCDELTKNAEGVSRLSDKLQSKNMVFGEQEVLNQSLHINDSSVPSNNDVIIIPEDEEVEASQSLKLREEFHKSSILHDPASYGDLPYSFTDFDELTTNAEGVFRLSDEIQSKNTGFGEVLNQSLHFNDCSVPSNNNTIIIPEEDEEVEASGSCDDNVPKQSYGDLPLNLRDEFRKSSILHDPASYGDLPYSFTDFDEVTTNAEGVFILSDELQSKNTGFGEVLNQSLHFNDCSVPSNTIIIPEDEEVDASDSCDIMGFQDSNVPKQSFQLNACCFRTPSLSGSSSSSSNKVETVSQRETIFLSLDDCIDVVPDQVEEDRQPQKNTVSDKEETVSGHSERVFLSSDDCIVIPDQLEEDRQPRKHAVSDKVRSGQNFSDEVEVIDLFTPSPCKKRRKRSETEIIDLTISPLVM